MDTKAFNEKNFGESRAVCERIEREDGGGDYKTEANKLHNQLNASERKSERRLRQIDHLESVIRNRNVELKERKQLIHELRNEVRRLGKQVSDLSAERENGGNCVVLTDREREILDMWPRYEGGEPVWFGDEVEMQDEIVREVWTFTLDVNAEGDKRLYLNGFQGLFVLPGERVKRPAPKVLDADGVEIKVGDTVWFKGNPRPYAVVEVKDGSVRLYSKPYCSEESATTVWTDILTHTPPDSWERLEEDASKEPCFYFGFEDKPCDDGAGCPANKLGNCSKLKAKDIIRRAKALAGVGE